MKFCPISSGSSGNCIYLETEKSKILIDAGLSGKRITNLLSEISINLSEINGIFVTHEHLDHIKGLGAISRRFGINVYANEKTWMAMRKHIGVLHSKNIKILENNKFMDIRDFTIHTIPIFHDASDPLAFAFYQKNQKITVLTDTGKIDENIKNSIRNSNIYYIEANYDIEMLKNGPYPIKLQNRILSDFGHLSNIDTSNVLKDILLGNDEKIILAHLSKENNLPKLAYKTVFENLKNSGLNLRKDISLSIANRDSISEFIDLN